MDWHHSVDKSFLRGCKRAQKYVKDNWHFFRSRVCNVHNAETKWADAKAAQSIIWGEKVRLWGREYCEQMLDGLRACYKVEPMQLRLEALLGKD